jgi:hypothetical protein
VRHDEIRIYRHKTFEKELHTRSQKISSNKNTGYTVLSGRFLSTSMKL